MPAPSLINHSYTGHAHLDGFGLINMNDRMEVYPAASGNPVIGRVLSPDIVVQAPGYTQSYNRYSYCLNNPLRYTDPSGYTFKPDDWNDAPVLSGYYFGPGPSGGLGAGSGNHWSDAFRTEYGNYMLGSTSSFNNMYGKGASDIAQFFANDPNLFNQWRQGMISIEKVRRDGGYWTQTAFTVNLQSPETITINGAEIVMSTNSGPGKISQHWMAVNNSSWIKTSIDYTGETASLLGLANQGILMAEFEFVRQARINRAISGNFSQPIKNSLRTISKTGKVLGGVKILMSGADMAINGVNVSNSLDLAFGSVAFVPGFGWAVSGLYVVSNWGVEIATGKDIGEHIQDVLSIKKH